MYVSKIGKIDVRGKGVRKGKVGNKSESNRTGA